MEKIREMLDNAAKAASNMIEQYTGTKPRIQVVYNEYYSDAHLQLIYNGNILFKHSWELTDKEETSAPFEEIMYGTLLTEMMLIFCITVSETRKALESKGV